MALFTLTGCSLLGAAGYTGYRQLNKGKRELKTLLNEVFEIANIETKRGDVQTGVQVQRPHIFKMKKRHYGYDVVLQLPKGFAVDKFREKLNVIEEATASKILMKYLKGRTVQLNMGMLPLYEKMVYSPDETTGRPVVPYYTPFGKKFIDFWDETCCHIIVAGATRMGKSVFLRLLFTNITLQMQGNVRWFYINNKVEDWYPLQKAIPRPAEDFENAFKMLEKIENEANERKKLLREAKDSVNIRQYREKHGGVPPVFVVIDEYGRFADDSAESKAFQDKITNIAETAGYLDIHLVIGTQRPDSSTVLKPRIRANILTRVCFQTADEANSKIVVHTNDAVHLDSIRGRAIVLDGMPELAHIPYVSEDQAEYLLKPYRRDLHGTQSEGFSNPQLASPLPSSVPRSTGEISVSGSSKTRKHRKPNYEKAR